jgi:hypothetical protein
VPLSNSDAAVQARSEAARHAIETRWARTTDPEQRRAAIRPARLASAVRTLVDNWPELTPEQVSRLRSLLQPPEGGEAA